MKRIKVSNNQIKRNRHESNMPRINLLRKSRKYKTNWKRPNKWAKFYGSKAWKQLRAQKLHDQPLCERCLEHERITPATTVHHRCVFGSCPTDEERWEWFLRPDNLVSLCARCHAIIHETNAMGYIYYYPFPDRFLDESLNEPQMPQVTT